MFKFKRVSPINDALALVFCLIDRAPIYRRVCKQWNYALWRSFFLNLWEKRFLVKGPNNITFISLMTKRQVTKWRRGLGFVLTNKYIIENRLYPYNGFLFPVLNDYMDYNSAYHVYISEYKYGRIVAKYCLNVTPFLLRTKAINVKPEWMEIQGWMKIRATTRNYYYYRLQGDPGWEFYPKWYGDTHDKWIKYVNGKRVATFVIDGGKVYLKTRYIVEDNRVPWIKTPQSIENNDGLEKCVKEAKLVFSNVKEYNRHTAWEEVNNSQSIIDLHNGRGYRYLEKDVDKYEGENCSFDMENKIDKYCEKDKKFSLEYYYTVK